MARPREAEGVDASTRLAMAAPRLLALRLDEVDRYRARAVLRRDAEDLHDLRVATRRLRAALALVGGVLAEAARGIKPFGDALGAVRDLDVLRAWLAEALPAATESERPGISRLDGELAARLPQREAALWALDEQVEQPLERVLRIHLHSAGGAEALGGPTVRRAVARWLRRFDRRLLALPSLDDVAAVHRVRIAGKKARYALELVERPFGEPATEALQRIRQLQGRLGEVHDRDAQLALLVPWLARAASQDALGGLLLLRHAHRERQGAAAALTREIVAWRADGVGARLAPRLARG